MGIQGRNDLLSRNTDRKPSFPDIYSSQQNTRVPDQSNSIEHGSVTAYGKQKHLLSPWISPCVENNTGSALECYFSFKAAGKKAHKNRQALLPIKAYQPGFG